jgi:hypothetical protein
VTRYKADAFESAMELCVRFKAQITFILCEIKLASGARWITAWMDASTNMNVLGKKRVLLLQKICLRSSSRLVANLLILLSCHL